jgi:biopolymer transport protein ExbB/TolQ
MNVVDLLDRGLFALGTLLHAPVVVLLWVCVVWVLALGGALFADALVRRRQRSGFDAAAWTEARNADGLPRDLAAFYREAAALARDARLRPRLEECLLRFETRIRDRAHPAQVLVKVGPSIGLLGTLIPMGGALAAMSQGNLESMSGQMVAAFTSTIIGLAAGTAAFVIAAVRLRWVAQDIRELRLLADLFDEEART